MRDRGRETEGGDEGRGDHIPVSPKCVVLVT